MCQTEVYYKGPLRLVLKEDEKDLKFVALWSEWMVCSYMHIHYTRQATNEERE